MTAVKRILITAAACATVAFSARASLVLSNSFSYPDGALDVVSAGSPLGVWISHNGALHEMQVASGKVIVTQQNSDDVSTYLTNAAFPTPFNSGKLYASFRVNFYELPTHPAGTFFWHLKDTGLLGVRAKVWALTNDAAPGTFRVGISTA